MSDDDDPTAVIDLSDAPGLQIQCVEGGFLVAVQALGLFLGCATEEEVLLCVQSFLDRLDEKIYWRETEPICAPGAVCILTQVSSPLSTIHHAVTYAVAGAGGSIKQFFCYGSDDVLRRAGTWLGYEMLLEPLGSEGTLAD